MFALMAGPVLPQPGAALWAASRASSTSFELDLGISQITLPVVGDVFSKYFPSLGAHHSPPIKFHTESLALISRHHRLGKQIA